MGKAVRDHLRNNLVGYVAMFLALTMGTAYATHGAPDSISTEDIINGQVKTNDIGNNQVRSADVRDDTLSEGGLAADDLGPDAVGTSELENSSVGASELKTDAVRTAEILDGTIGTADLSATALGARAYGYVTGAATLSRSKNVDSVTTGGTGIYCIDPAAEIDPAAAVLIVGGASGLTSTGLADQLVVEWDSSGAGCAAGRLTVRTYNYNGDATDDDGGFADSPGDIQSPVNAAFAFMIP